MPLNFKKRIKNENKARGFILFPVLIIMSIIFMGLLSLNQSLYAHVFLYQETLAYLSAETEIKTFMPQLEQDLEDHPPPTLTPQDLDQRLQEFSHWTPWEQGRYHHQWVHTDAQDNVYSSLIAISDPKTPRRLLIELMSSCSLADHHCRPLQWATL